MVEENPEETEDPFSDPDEVMMENDEIAEKEPHEEQVTAHDVYTADAGVGSPKRGAGAAARCESTTAGRSRTTGISGLQQKI